MPAETMEEQEPGGGRDVSQKRSTGTEQIHGGRGRTCGSREREGGKEGRALVPDCPGLVPVLFLYVVFSIFEFHGVYSNSKISFFLVSLGGGPVF